MIVFSIYHSIMPHYIKIQRVLIALLLFCSAFALAAQTTPYDGTYRGTISQLHLKGKSYSNHTAIFVLKSGTLYCDFPKVGKMPGNLVINFPIQVDDATGVLQTASPKAGVMNIFFSKIKLDLVRFDHATIKPDGTLIFDLALKGKYMGMVNFPASFHFEGKRQ